MFDFFNNKKGLLGDIILISLLLVTVTTFYFIFSSVIESDIIESDLHLHENNAYVIPSVLLRSQVMCSGGITNYIQMKEFCNEEEIEEHIEDLFNLFDLSGLVYFQPDSQYERWCFQIEKSLDVLARHSSDICEREQYGSDPNFIYRDGELDVDYDGSSDNIRYHFYIGDESYGFYFIL